MSEKLENILVYPASSPDFERVSDDIKQRTPPFPVTIDSGYPPKQIGIADSWRFSVIGIFCSLEFDESIDMCCKQSNRLGLDSYDLRIDGEVKQGYKPKLAWAFCPPDYDDWFHVNFSASG